MPTWRVFDIISQFWVQPKSWKIRLNPKVTTGALERQVASRYLVQALGSLFGDVATWRYGYGLGFVPTGRVFDIISQFWVHGNHEIAIRHWKIAAEAGHQKSLDALKCIYNAGSNEPGKEFISKEEMDTIYRSGHGAQMEVKTEEREKTTGLLVYSI